jgi:hypothetical protein
VTTTNGVPTTNGTLGTGPPGTNGADSGDSADGATAMSVARTATTPGTPAGTSAPTVDPATGRALAALLAVEHASVYGCASAGGALAPLGPAAEGARELARAAYLAHRALRDTLTSMLLDAGVTPPPALPAYTLPVTPNSAVNALTLLADVEDRTAGAAYDALATVAGPSRALAADALGQAALRGQRARLAAGESPAAAGRALPGRL